MNGVVAVDDGQVQILKGSRKLRCFNLGNVQVLRIFLNIVLRRVDAGICLQFDQSLCFQKQQSPCLVRRIIRDADGCSVLKGIERFCLAGINAEWLIMDGSGRNQIRSVFLIVLIQVRLMLEIIRIQGA